MIGGLTKQQPLIEVQRSRFSSEIDIVGVVVPLLQERAVSVTEVWTSV